MLNYHHLRYFWAVARERSLTRAARSLHVSPSALSVQIRELEAAVGQPLFDRARKGLTLTESGRVALKYADDIFRAGQELQQELAGQAAPVRVLRVGAVATLSRNFQLECLRPLLGQADVDVVVRSGTLRDLLARLEAHEVDLVLSNLPARTDTQRDVNNHLLARHPVSLVAPRGLRLPRAPFPQNIAGVPILLPSRDSAIRAGFDTLMERAGLSPRIAAEVDDMAMLRLLARESRRAVALVPPVVVRDELRTGRLREVLRVQGLEESFYAILPRRRFPNPLARLIVDASVSG